MDCAGEGQGKLWVLVAVFEKNFFFIFRLIIFANFFLCTCRYNKSPITFTLKCFIVNKLAPGGV